jgi:hypothetical protein
VQQCNFKSPSGAVDLDKPSQWFGRLNLVLLNNGDKVVKGAIIDVTPELPPWEVWASYDQLLHHRVSIQGDVKPGPAKPLTYELNKDDYTYLVDIKWETSCWIVSAKSADGTTWKNPATLSR